MVPDFRLNKAFDRLNTLSEAEKRKVEFLCNECCWIGCSDRKACYENVSRKNLGLYLKELFEGYYQLQDKLDRDLAFDKKEGIEWI